MKKMLFLMILFLALFIPYLGSPQTSFSADDQIGFYLEQKRSERIIELKRSEFSLDNLKEYLKLRQVKNSQVVLRQAALETGWFTSRSFTEYNNLTGMKVPRKRDHAVKRSGYGHAGFDHWTDSIDDYILWQRYWQAHGYDQDDYYDFLSEVGYATDPLYLKKLMKIEI